MLTELLKLIFTMKIIKIRAEFTKMWYGICVSGTLKWPRKHK